MVEVHAGDALSRECCLLSESVPRLISLLLVQLQREWRTTLILCGKRRHLLTFRASVPLSFFSYFFKSTFLKVPF